MYLFLRPRASRPRNIGTYVFTATRKTLLYIIIVIFAENASFKEFISSAMLDPGSEKSFQTLCFKPRHGQGKGKNLVNMMGIYIFLIESCIRNNYVYN